MKALHLIAGIFVLLAVAAQELAPPAPKQAKPRHRYVCSARAVCTVSPSSTTRSVPVMSATRPSLAKAAAKRERAEGRRRRKAVILRIIVLVLTVLVLTLILAILSKAITLCIMESIIADHERQRRRDGGDAPVPGTKGPPGAPPPGTPGEGQPGGPPADDRREGPPLEELEKAPIKDKKK